MEPNDPIPLFLSNPTKVPEQAGSLQPWERAVTASRITAGIWLVTAAAIVFAVLSVRNPLALFENATASLFATSTPQDGTGQSMPIGQSAVGVQALPPIAREAPTGPEIAANLKTADQSQTDIRQPSAEASLNQFQAWVEDAPAQVRPVQPVQDAQVRVMQTVPEQVQPVQKQRQVRHVRNARAKVVKNARAQVRPENVPVRDRSAQNAQAPRLLQSLRRQN
jgi:hypothetical protein